MDESLMTEKLARRGLKVGSDYEVDRSKTTHVEEIMTTDIVMLPFAATVDEAHELIAERPHSLYPVVDPDGRCTAVVLRHDLLASPPDTSISELPATTYTESAPGETLHDLLSRLLSDGACVVLAEPPPVSAAARLTAGQAQHRRQQNRETRLGESHRSCALCMPREREGRRWPQRCAALTTCTLP